MIGDCDEDFYVGDVTKDEYTSWGQSTPVLSTLMGCPVSSDPPGVDRLEMRLPFEICRSLYDSLASLMWTLISADAGCRCILGVVLLHKH